MDEVLAETGILTTPLSHHYERMTGASQPAAAPHLVAQRTGHRKVTPGSVDW